jgi:hypothetical protein
VLDVLVQSRRDKPAAKRLMRKLLKRYGRPCVIVTDKLRSYAAANNELGLSVEHRQPKGLNNRAENSHQPTRVREKVMRRFKSARQLQRFASVHGQVSNLFMGCRYNRDAKCKREARAKPERPGIGLRAPAWRHRPIHSVRGRSGSPRVADGDAAEDCRNGPWAVVQNAGFEPRPSQLPLQNRCASACSSGGQPTQRGFPYRTINGVDMQPRKIGQHPLRRQYVTAFQLT